MFHIYVANICFRCFIYFTRMLHSSVFMLHAFLVILEELGGAGSDGGMA
jgi:hypothetical protein